MNRDDFTLRQVAITQTVHSVLRCRIKDVHLIDDLCQDVLLKCWKYERHTGVLLPERFVAAVARNHYVSWLRKRRPGEWPKGLDDESSDEDPAEFVEQAERKMHLASMLQALPIQYRDTAWLHIIEGWTHDRIAREKGLSITTVKRQFREAKNLLVQAATRYLVN
jgi:RNA polymerase sigma factor (sigma-70 family)